MRAGFDGADAENAPAGGDHLVDQVGFYGCGGLVGGDVFGANVLVEVRIASRMVLREVNPWRRELREDFSRVAGDLGPRDLAPLAGAVSDFSFDVILGNSPSFPG